MPVEARLKAEDAKEDLNNALKKSFRLSGLTLSDVSIIEATDRDMKINRDSHVINAKLKNDGGYYSYSQLYSENQMHLIREFAAIKAEETANSIIDGKIEVAPIQDGCKFCPYGSMCMFDRRLPDYGFRKIASMKEEEFFEKLEELKESRLPTKSV